MGGLDVLVVLGFVAALAATLRLVWRGGTTWNDHAVAAVVSGCLAVYPTLWLGGRLAGAAGVGLLCLVTVGMVAVWGLFAVLDTRREQDALRPLVVLSQVAYSFSLWLGLFVLMWWLAAAALWGAGLLEVSATTLLWPWPLFGPAFGLAVWGVTWTALTRDTVRVVRIPIAPGERAVRVVQLSDLHASPTTTGRDLRRTVDVALSLAPDMVVVTGDLVMPYSEDRHEWLLDALARISVPVVVCPGNHDLPVAERLRQELAERGVHWAADDRVVVPIQRGTETLAVEVVGVDFVWQRLADHVRVVVDALPPVSDTTARLLLLHDPRGFGGVPAGRFDLVMCGHTHGGQVGTDMFGVPGSVLGLFGLYDQGLFQREGARMWVHRGNWHWGLPPRMGIGTEVVAFDLVPVG
jgi:predicted MPP superfamily phosphohydrolase